MAKKTKAEGVYRIVDVVGVSETSWEDAGRRAVETAAGSLRDLRVAEVTKWICAWTMGRLLPSAPGLLFRSNTSPRFYGLGWSPGENRGSKYAASAISGFFLQQ